MNLIPPIWTVQQSLIRFMHPSLNHRALLGRENNFRQGSDKEGNDKYIKPRPKKNKQIQNIPVEQIPVERIQALTTSPTPRPPRWSMVTQQKREILERYGVEMRPGALICFMCLGSHIRTKCPHYGRELEYKDLCMKTIDGERYAFGFHPRATCTHGETGKFGRKLPGKHGDSKARHDQAPQSEKSFRNSNWKHINIVY